MDAPYLKLNGVRRLRAWANQVTKAINANKALSGISVNVTESADGRVINAILPESVLFSSGNSISIHPAPVTVDIYNGGGTPHFQLTRVVVSTMDAGSSAVADVSGGATYGETTLLTGVAFDTAPVSNEVSLEIPAGGWVSVDITSSVPDGSPSNLCRLQYELWGYYL